jgi:hypothetical protein
MGRGRGTFGGRRMAKEKEVKSIEVLRRRRKSYKEGKEVVGKKREFS